MFSFLEPVYFESVPGCVDTMEGDKHSSVGEPSCLPATRQHMTRHPLEGRGSVSSDEVGGVGVHCFLALDLLWNECELLGMGVTDPSPSHVTSCPPLAASVLGVRLIVKGLVFLIPRSNK